MVKKYVGQTDNLKRRLSQHFRSKKHTNEANYKRDSSTFRRREDHSNSKLDNNKVIYIKDKFKNRNETVRDFCYNMSNKFGISETAIENIVYNRSWVHVKGS